MMMMMFYEIDTIYVCVFVAYMGGHHVCIWRGDIEKRRKKEKGLNWNVLKPHCLFDIHTDKFIHTQFCSTFSIIFFFCCDLRINTAHFVRKCYLLFSLDVVFHEISTIFPMANKKTRIENVTISMNRVSQHCYHFQVAKIPS